MGGWNARDPISTMPETDAIQLDNIVNVSGALQVRGGTASWATLTNYSSVGTLAVWNGPTSSELWAFAQRSTNATGAFNVSTTGTKSSNASFDAFSRTHSPILSWVMFNNVAGHYLYTCVESGADVPAHYNGTTWVEPAITGVTAADLVHVSLFKYRLFFVEKASLSVWYLPIDAIAGAATEMPLGGYFNKGGYILATGTWTVDGGDGIDDLFCVVTNVGQVAVFSGTNPASASSWELVGVFDIAEPLGERRCLSKFGADLYVLTVDGMFSIANVMAGRVMGDDAFTEKIRTAFSNYGRSYKDEQGWQALYYPRGRQLIINVPTENTANDIGGDTVQFVYSTTTKTWSRFTNIKGTAWTVFDERLYYCRVAEGTPSSGDGTVYRADDGTSDVLGATVGGQANTIQVAARQAYAHFDDPARIKYVTMARPVFETDATTFGVRAVIEFDYQRSTFSNTDLLVYNNTGSGGASNFPYDDTASVVQREWLAGGLGRAVSIAWKANVKDALLGWLSTDYVLRPAAPIGVL